MLTDCFYLRLDASLWTMELQEEGWSNLVVKVAELVGGIHCLVVKEFWGEHVPKPFGKLDVILFE